MAHVREAMNATEDMIELFIAVIVVVAAVDARLKLSDLLDC
jgi:hypothetical protein